LTDFAQFIADSRAALLDRQARLTQELDELAAEMAAIDAYEQAKRQRLGPAHPAKSSGRYPHPHDGTLSVPQAGREFLGLSESGSWLALKRGDIPAIKIGRFRRVPVAEMRQKLEERRAAE